MARRGAKRKDGPRDKSGRLIRTESIIPKEALLRRAEACGIAPAEVKKAGRVGVLALGADAEAGVVLGRMRWVRTGAGGRKPRRMQGGEMVITDEMQDAADELRRLYALYRRATAGQGPKEPTALDASIPPSGRLAGYGEGIDTQDQEEWRVRRVAAWRRILGILNAQGVGVRAAVVAVVIEDRPPEPLTPRTLDMLRAGLLTVHAALLAGRSVP